MCIDRSEEHTCESEETKNIRHILLYHVISCSTRDGCSDTCAIFRSAREDGVATARGKPNFIPLQSERGRSTGFLGLGKAH